MQERVYLNLRATREPCRLEAGGGVLLRILFWTSHNSFKNFFYPGIISEERERYHLCIFSSDFGFFHLEERAKTKENVGRGMLQESGTRQPAAAAAPSQWHTRSGLAQSLFVGG